MSEERRELGRLVAVYGPSAQALQRAVIVAVLSFLFFLAMMFTFYLRQSILYFLLATAFLIVYLVMMFSLFSMKRATVRVFERGLEYRKHILNWHEISGVGTDDHIEIRTTDGKAISFPSALAEREALLRHINFHIGPVTRRAL